MLAVDQKQKRESQASVALEKLLEVAQSLTGIEGDSKTILQKIAASACAVLGADIVVLYEYDERHDDVRVPPVTWGILRDPEHLETKDASHTSSAIFRILSHEKPIYAHNAGRDWKQSTAETPSGLPSKGFISREGIASSAAVRLMAGRERVGALFINYRTPHTFRASERRNIELFAAQAAVAIRNGRMVAEQSRQHKGHETLNQVGADLASMQDEIAILDRVAKATFETIECQHCTVFRVEGETLVVVASRGNRAWSLPLGLERERKGVAGWVADQGQSALVDDTVVDGRFDPNWSPGQPDPRSLIDVPVNLAGSPYAIISVEHDRIRAFDAHDRQLVETLATQAAQALRNTWLIDGLNQVGQKALRSDQELCQTIVDLVYRLTRCPVAFWRVDPAKSTQAVIIAHEGLRPEYAEDRSLDLETSVVGQVIRTAECANVFDIQEDPRVSKETKTEANLRGWKSLLIVPLLISSGEAMGALSIYSLTRREFAGWEIDLLRAFAGQAGVVMQNTERLRALRQVSTQLSGQGGMEEVYRRIVDGLKGIFPGTSCGIRSYSSETNKFESLIATGLLDGMLDHPPRSNGASAFVIARRTPRYLEGDALAVPIDGGPALRESLLQSGH